MSARQITVTLTLPQAIALLLAVDDHRQSQVENGQNVRALDNAAEVLSHALVTRNRRTRTVS